MFTGIIEELGEVVATQVDGDSARLTIRGETVTAGTTLAVPADPSLVQAVDELIRDYPDLLVTAAAHDLLAAMLDNHLHFGNELDLDERNITWRRVLDVNDRSLRDIVVGRDQVRTAIDSATTLLDLRSPEEFSGARVSPQSEPIDHGAERSGHIPGAKSLPAQDFLDSNGRLRPVAEIRALLGAAAVDDAEEIIAYCRLSHRAALGWLVFTELLDDHRVRVYDGSWTEWGSLVGAPVATGRSDDGDGDLP